MSDKEQVVSDGGSTSYYAIPEWATELRHLMEHKNMTPDQANIFKAAYRLGEKSGTSLEYDLNKIIFFANDMAMATRAKFFRPGLLRTSLKFSLTASIILLGDTRLPIPYLPCLFLI